MSHEPVSSQTDLNGPIDTLMQIQKKRAMVIVISDFINIEFEKKLKLAARKYDLIGIGIEDSRDLSLPNVGVLDVVDPETGRVMPLNTSSSQFQEFYKKKALADRHKISSAFQKRGANFIWHSSSTPIVRTIRELMTKRIRKRR